MRRFVFLPKVPQCGMIPALSIIVLEKNRDRALLIVDRSNQGPTKAAIKAGVSAYRVEGLRSDRINLIPAAAIARFHLCQRMRTELAATKRALEECRVMDRAKGILMKARRLTGEEAYALLRKAAVDQGRKVADVAEALVTAAGSLT